MAKERIFKDCDESGFVQIPNALAQDRTISRRAKGLLIEILSLPNDWIIYKEYFYKQEENMVSVKKRTSSKGARVRLLATGYEGRTAIDFSFREIEEAGYIKRNQIRDERGRFIGWETIVSNKPKFKKQENHRKVDNPGFGATDIGEATTTNTYLTNTSKKIKKVSSENDQASNLRSPDDQDSETGFSSSEKPRQKEALEYKNHLRDQIFNPLKLDEYKNSYPWISRKDIEEFVDRNPLEFYNSGKRKIYLTSLEKHLKELNDQRRYEHAGP